MLGISCCKWTSFQWFWSNYNYCVTIYRSSQCWKNTLCEAGAPFVPRSWPSSEPRPCSTHAQEVPWCNPRPQGSSVREKWPWYPHDLRQQLLQKHFGQQGLDDGGSPTCHRQEDKALRQENGQKPRLLLQGVHKSLHHSLREQPSNRRQGRDQATVQCGQQAPLGRSRSRRS